MNQPDYKTLLFNTALKMNHFKLTDVFVANTRLLAFVISEIDKVLGREGRLQFLSKVYDRKITTSKIDAPNGLHPHEAASIILWAKPFKIEAEYDNGGWTVDACVKQVCIAFQIEHLGQKELL